MCYVAIELRLVSNDAGNETLVLADTFKSPDELLAVLGFDLTPKDTKLIHDLFIFNPLVLKRWDLISYKKLYAAWIQTIQIRGT